LPTARRADANVFTIAASLPFAQTLARGMRERFGADPLELSRATIYVPTRRATRTLSDAFAALAGGAALLPEIRPLGDVDEEEFLFDAAAEMLDMPPAIAPVRRRLLLARLVRAFHAKALDENLTTAQAAGFAKSLAVFFDEVETHGADLSRLKSLEDGAFADHWNKVRTFISILDDYWPQELANEGCEDPARYRNQALKALAARLSATPPKHPVIAAGSTGSIPATAQLLNTISRLANGFVVLPGLDRELDDASWDALNEGHPQYGLKQLLAHLGVERCDVRDWTDDAPPRPQREYLLREILRPAPTTDAWRAIADNKSEAQIAAGLEGLSTVVAASPREEAETIALILRHALEPSEEDPDQKHTAALVTPDRNLARRVAAELQRWDIAIDDSAGRPLAHTPPGAFLCLLAEAADAAFAPVPLLALLKYPLCAFGQEPGAFRAMARALDREVLRGPRPDPGLDALAKLIARKKNDAVGQWFAPLAKALAPFAEFWAESEIQLRDLVDAHVALAEKLAATDTQNGATRLWSQPAGEAAARLVAALREASKDVVLEPGSYPALFRGFAMEAPVRPPYGRHPRLSILGAQEARLQSFDLVVLGGLNEGTWPAAAANDPWLSRPMRHTLELEQPERAIGLAAHDFATLCANARVVLTRASKDQGAPTVASRWWQRLAQLTNGLELQNALKPKDDYVQFAKQRDAVAEVRPVARPAPKPDVSLRPDNFSFTDIEKWVRDPYAIYARRVLCLRPLDPLDGEFGPRERGIAMHKALDIFVKQFPGELPPDAGGQLIAIGERVFAEMALPKSVLALWQPRFDSAAMWFAELERERRANILSSHSEIKGEHTFALGARTFTLRGRADRIDILASGGASIVDYKTGAPPSKTQVEILAAPQLPLEGAMLALGGFPPLGKIAPAEFLYVHFSGRAEGGTAKPLDLDAAEQAAEAQKWLLQWVAWFNDPSTPYLSRYWPQRKTDVGDYDHLARVREWQVAGNDEGEE
jgi:ATP-dependent helicase/nuclease subunit B